MLERFTTLSARALCALFYSAAPKTRADEQLLVSTVTLTKPRYLTKVVTPVSLEHENSAESLVC